MKLHRSCFRAFLFLQAAALPFAIGCSSSGGDDDEGDTSPTPTAVPETPTPVPDTPTATPTHATDTPVHETPTPTPGPTPPAHIEGCDVVVSPSDDDYTTVQTAFLTAPEGSTICLTEGDYKFGRDISVSTHKITVEGIGDARMDFEGQTGANAILISGDDFTLQDITVLNPSGDGVRASQVNNVTFRNVSVIWENGPATENGGYGLYPVLSDGVTVESCVVTGASDAGIYVGQSNNVLLMGNEAYGNVAGIEIENCYDSEVMHNHAHDNTGGILVFNLPGLSQNGGGRANVHDNLIEHNNHENFAEEGNIVAIVPQGTGMLLLASDYNEFHDNQIEDNQSVGIAVVSYTELLIGSAPPEDFDEWAEGNYIHDNTLVNNGTDPQDKAKTLVSATLGLGEDAPQLIWDGCVDESKDNTDGSLTNCFMANVDGDDAPATYGNMALCNDFPNNFTTDATDVTCTHASLPTQESTDP